MKAHLGPIILGGSKAHHVRGLPPAKRRREERSRRKPPKPSPKQQQQPQRRAAPAPQDGRRPHRRRRRGPRRRRRPRRGQCLPPPSIRGDPSRARAAPSCLPPSSRTDLPAPRSWFGFGLALRGAWGRGDLAARRSPSRRLGWCGRGESAPFSARGVDGVTGFGAAACWEPMSEAGVHIRLNTSHRALLFELWSSISDWEVWLHYVLAVDVNLEFLKCSAARLS